MGGREARTAALRLFGGMDKVREECRQTWGMRMIEMLIQDVRYGLRGLRRHPAFRGGRHRDAGAWDRRHHGDVQRRAAREFSTKEL